MAPGRPQGHNCDLTFRVDQADPIAAGFVQSGFGCGHLVHNRNDPLAKDALHRRLKCMYGRGQRNGDEKGKNANGGGEPL